MSNKAIVTTQQTQNATMLLNTSASMSANHRQRLTVFVGWLDANKQNWYSPDIAAYRDYLLDYEGKRGKLSPASVKAYISTVRGKLRKMSTSNAARDFMFELAPTTDILERKAFVDETITRLQNAINPDNSKVKVTKEQDVIDSKHTRLTPSQVNHLVSMPGTETLLALRDTAILALMACTGIRRAELCNVKVQDLRQSVNGELCLNIPKGKGNKQRAVPYGGLSWCLPVIDRWLHFAGITEGDAFVFRGVRKGAKSTLYDGAITEGAINKLFERYQMTIKGKIVAIKPHDLRRSYAKNLYKSGIDILQIRDNLGHSDHKTTLRYIGVSDVESRAPESIYSFDLNTLPDIEVQETLPGMESV